MGGGGREKIWGNWESKVRGFYGADDGGGSEGKEGGEYSLELRSCRPEQEGKTGVGTKMLCSNLEWYSSGFILRILSGTHIILTILRFKPKINN